MLAHLTRTLINSVALGKCLILRLEASCSQEAAVKVPCVQVERSRQVYQGPKVKEYYLSSTLAASKPHCTEPVTVTKLLKNMSSQSK